MEVWASLSPESWPMHCVPPRSEEEGIALWHGIQKPLCPAHCVTFITQVYFWAILRQHPPGNGDVSRTAWAAQAPNIRFDRGSSFSLFSPSSSLYPVSHHIMSTVPPHCPLDMASPFYWPSCSYIPHYSHLLAGFPTSAHLLPFFPHTCNRKVVSNSSGHGTHLPRTLKGSHCLQHKSWLRSLTFRDASEVHHLVLTCLSSWLIPTPGSPAHSTCTDTLAFPKLSPNSSFLLFFNLSLYLEYPSSTSPSAALHNRTTSLVPSPCQRPISLKMVGQA